MMERSLNFDRELEKKNLPDGIFEFMVHDVQIQTLVACAFLLGDRGVEKNIETAMLWFEKAAAQGSVSALHNLGEYHLHKQAYTKAAAYFQKASEKGFDVSTHRLGLILEMREGEEKDGKRAIDYFEQAATKGYLPSVHHLAKKLDLGRGCTQDRQRAFELETQAALKDYPPAQSYLAGLFAERGDMQSAVQWYTKAALRGNVVALRALGYIHAHGYDEIPVNLPLALVYFSLATNDGSAATLHMAEKLQSRMSETELTEAERIMSEMNIDPWCPDPGPEILISHTHN